eukprot:343644-Pelagomonas_calceolata.AAC.1
MGACMKSNSLIITKKQAATATHHGVIDDEQVVRRDHKHVLQQFRVLFAPPHSEQGSKAEDEHGAHHNHHNCDESLLRELCSCGCTCARAPGNGGKVDLRRRPHVIWGRHGTA